MIVVSDTSPITALITVREIELLQNLFGEVFIPEAVRVELLRSHSELPDWLQCRRVATQTAVDRFAKIV